MIIINFTFFTEILLISSLFLVALELDKIRNFQANEIKTAIYYIESVDTEIEPTENNLGMFLWAVGDAVITWAGTIFVGYVAGQPIQTFSQGLPFVMGVYMARFVIDIFF